jgi:hypothetical protein
MICNHLRWGRRSLLARRRDAIFQVPKATLDKALIQAMQAAKVDLVKP